MGRMSRQENIRARRLRIELWVYALEDEEMPAARDVAEGMGEGLGDAWYQLDDGDEYAISYVWQAEYSGSTVDAILEHGAISARTSPPEG